MNITNPYSNKKHPWESAKITISYNVWTKSYDAEFCGAGYYLEDIPAEQVLYTIDELQVVDFISRLNLFVSENGLMPHSENPKMSEYLELSCIHLYRLDEHSFVVFNRYHRPISGIEGVMKFKKREEA